jgi:hypothetical protein
MILVLPTGGFLIPHRFTMTVVTLAFAAAVWLPASAVAAPPNLISASQDARQPTATWSLPTHGQSRFVEVATSPATNSSGYFLTSNHAIFEMVGSAVTSWKATGTLRPGTYYLHVGGSDSSCFPTCPFTEFSQIATISIPPYGPCGTDHLPLIRDFRSPATLEWNRRGTIKATATYGEGSWFFNRGVDVVVNGVPAGQIDRFGLEFDGLPVTMPEGESTLNVSFGWWEELIGALGYQCSQSAVVTIRGVRPPACRDRSDNDGDGRIDLNDPGCRGRAAGTSERDPRPVRSVFGFRRVTGTIGRVVINRVVVRPDITPKRLFPFTGTVVLRVRGLSGSARGTTRVKRLRPGFSLSYQFRNLPPGRYQLTGSYSGDRYRLRSRPDLAIVAVQARPVAVAPAQRPPPPARSRCDSSYPTVCIPPYPPDLDCDEVLYSNFRVIGRDPHGFDGDGDGVGCED